MSTHKRKNIRDKVKELIEDNITDFENVYVNRETPQWQTDLPCVVIYSGDEQADPRDTRARQYIRTFELKLDVKVEANDTVDDDLDALCIQIEELFVDNYSLEGIVLDMIYKSSQPSLDATGEKLTGIMTMNYEIKYIQ